MGSERRLGLSKVTSVVDIFLEAKASDVASVTGICSSCFSDFS